MPPPLMYSDSTCGRHSSPLHTIKVCFLSNSKVHAGCSRDIGRRGDSASGAGKPPQSNRSQITTLGFHPNMCHVQSHREQAPRQPGPDNARIQMTQMSSSGWTLISEVSVPTVETRTEHNYAAHCSYSNRVFC